MNYPKVEKPTEPGWYWYHRTGQRATEWFPMQVYRRRHGPSPKIILVARFTGGFRYMPLTDLPGEWLGPIPYPRAP